MRKLIFNNITAVATVALALSAGTAWAQPADVAEVSKTVGTQMIALGSLAGIVAFLAGFVFGIMGFMKLKANAANPNDPSNKVSTGFILIFVGAALIAVPTVMGVGVGSIFGDGGDNTSLTENGGGFTTID
ncbi:hypothetical protein LCGC14_0112260 [marine sediment metagenome]|uniref:TrbC/VIRB2 family protein n=2 Tax=root TaxID=1 RepID=A0A7V1BFB2_9RHOB|nr:hypothetical protein [Sulfitobacter litoralis]HDZ51505.1 hypothetical protein [Sulfitobacter litoralis]